MNRGHDRRKRASASPAERRPAIVPFRPSARIRPGNFCPVYRGTGMAPRYSRAGFYWGFVQLQGRGCPQ